jgi:biotin transporter BioY
MLAESNLYLLGVTGTPVQAHPCTEERLFKSLMSFIVGYLVAPTVCSNISSMSNDPGHSFPRS